MSEPVQGEIRLWKAAPPNHPMGNKNRMWVVVSRDAFNRMNSYVLLCPLTSYPATELDIAVAATPNNPLERDSAMLPRMITPVLKRELGPGIGRLPSKIMRHVVDRLRLLTEVI